MLGIGRLHLSQMQTGVRLFDGHFHIPLPGIDSENLARALSLEIGHNQNASSGLRDILVSATARGARWFDIATTFCGCFLFRGSFLIPFATPRVVTKNISSALALWIVNGAFTSIRL